MSVFGFGSSTKKDQHLVARLAIALVGLTNSPIENKPKLDVIKSEFQKIIGKSLKSDKGVAPHVRVSFFFINALELNETLFEFNKTFKDNKAALTPPVARSVSGVTIGPAFSNMMNARLAAGKEIVRTAASPNNLKKRLAALKTSTVAAPGPAWEPPAIAGTLKENADIIQTQVHIFREDSQDITDELVLSIFGKKDEDYGHVMFAKQAIILSINRGIRNMNATGYSKHEEISRGGGRRKSTRSRKSTRRSKRTVKKTRRH